jgi:PIN domain nuclease of toxin-antitoxin system
MRLLLDTHALIWLVMAPDRLGHRARAAITANVAEVYASHVSLWEMAIKRRLGKLEVLDRPAVEWFREFVPRSNLRQLTIAAEHLREVESLPLLHGDPFDRMIVAQAVVEGLTIVTHDPLVVQYAVETIA